MPPFFQQLLDCVRVGCRFILPLQRERLLRQRRSQGFVVQVVRIRLLDAGRVRQQVFAGRVGRPGADDAAGKTVLGDHRYPAGVIGVGVGKHHVGEDAGIKGQHSVFFRRLPAPALKQPAVEQDTVALRADEVHGSGDFPHGAIKGDKHDSPQSLKSIDSGQPRGPPVSSPYLPP